MSNHIYWRIYITEAQSGPYISVREIEMHQTLGGSDITTGGTATASSDHGGYVPSQAFDDNTGTLWITNGISIPQWIKYQFASPVDIAEFSIRSYSTYAPKSFELQYSDNNIDWVTTISYSGETGWSDSEVRTYNGFSGTITGSITEGLDITDWRITATRCVDGSFSGTSTSNGSSYSVNCAYSGPHVITLSVKVDMAWSAGMAVTLNTYGIASDPNMTPYLFKCTTDGTTGGVEPTWNTIVTGTTTDGSVVWTCIAPLVDPVSLGPKIPT